MIFQLDANILLRAAGPGHPQHATAEAAISALVLRAHALILVPQNLYEFWPVATRSVADNGLGVTTPEAAAELVAIRTRFPLLDDTPGVRVAWERLVVTHDVKGKPTHDARLVAAMLVHGVGDLLTFNTQHFRRFLPTIRVHDPATVAATPP